MSPWAAIFLVVSAFCGVFGFFVLSGALAAPAQLLFAIFLVLGIVAFSASMIRRHTSLDLMDTRDRGRQHFQAQQQQQQRPRRSRAR